VSAWVASRYAGALSAVTRRAGASGGRVTVRCGAAGRDTLRGGGGGDGRAIARGADVGRAAAGAAAREGGGAGRAAGAAEAPGLFCCWACATVMNAKDTAAVSVTRAVTLVPHMPADLTRHRSGLSNMAFGVEFARYGKFLAVMLPAFPVLAVFRLPGHPQRTKLVRLSAHGFRGCIRSVVMKRLSTDINVSQFSSNSAAPDTFQIPFRYSTRSLFCALLSSSLNCVS
jgi:hypothetical protein